MSLFTVLMCSCVLKGVCPADSLQWHSPSLVCLWLFYPLSLRGWHPHCSWLGRCHYSRWRTIQHFPPFTFHKHTAFAWVAPVRDKMSNLGFFLKKTIPDGSSPGSRARGDLVGKQYWLCKYRCHCSIIALFFSQEEGRIEINVVSSCMESQKTGISVVVWSDIFYKGQQFLGYFFISPRLFNIFLFIEMAWNGSCLKL